MKNERFIKKWEKERQKGMKKYILNYGIFIGIGCFAGYTLGRIIKGNFFDLFWEYYVYMHLASLVGGFLGGVFAANLRWGWNEEKYNKLTSNTKI